MDNNGTVSASPAEPGGAFSPAQLAGPDRRSAADWAGLVLLAVAVLVSGVLVGVLGPLFAIACESCQDGVRSPLRFGDALLAAQGAVPLTVLGTVVGIFMPRGGARAGGIGLAALAMLLMLMVVLGQFTG